MKEKRPGNTAILSILLGLALLGMTGMGALFFTQQRRPYNTSQRLGNSAQDNLAETSDGKLQGVVVQTYRQYSDVPAVPKGLFNYGGSTTFAPLRSPNIVQPIEAAFPQFQLRFTVPTIGKPGSSKGIQMLMEGQLSFSQSSRGLTEEEIAQAKTRGLTLEEIPVAIDGIALFAHPQVLNGGLKGLTLAQVSNIFTGKIRNWKEIGGPDLKIIPVSRPSHIGGTVDFFSESVLQKIPFSENVKEVGDTTEGIRLVGRTLGAISYATASEIINQKTIRPVALARNEGQSFILPCEDMTCATVNTKAFSNASYPITRRLFVVIKRDGRLDEQAGVAYANLLLSDEGQKSVLQAGFVPIR
jgi:phosphate transport system substrate-binding protein